MKILVAEDQQDLNNVITKVLKLEGYTVDQAFDGKETQDYIDMGIYDVILLDIMMPYVDGFEILTTLRKNNDITPVLFLTAKDALDDRVNGLDLGADDYIIKPFEFDELLARIRNALRKKYVNPTNILQLEDLTLDTSKHLVKRGNQLIELSSKEFSILELFMRNENIVLSRARIEENIWGYDYNGASNMVDVYIRYLRKKIDDGYPTKLLHTVRGVGYVLKIKK